MMRMFKQHMVRECLSLDGEWTFYFPQSGSQISVTEYANGQRETMMVPQVWESLHGHVNYRGQAVARKMFSVRKSGAARLVFKGICHTATVYLDGEKVGFHHNAFTPFTIDLPEILAGEHELLVHISNEFGELSALHIPNDYYTYGGITRPCGVEFLNKPLYIRHVHVVTECVGGQWSACCKAVVCNLGFDALNAELCAEIAGGAVNLQQDFQPGETEVEFALSPSAVAPWQPGNPNLYSLNLTLGDAAGVFDDLIERVGFRTSEVCGEQILLNGKAVYILGVNRHEDHPDYACAIPVCQMRKDLQLIRELNCNLVRTCHYPNDERFLDLCDEMGILVWEENHARGLNKELMEHPKLSEQCAACNEEMVREHFNHPSIIMWGLLNECNTGDEEGRAEYKKQIEQLRALDASRPITYASCYHDTDRCQDLPDICSWNLYSRWYANNDVAEDAKKMVERFEPTGMAGKPLIISEFGAGALPGFSDPVRRAKWSLERQADILEESIRAYTGYTRITGQIIWQFCDVRVTEEKWFSSRPRTMNNKGLVDEYRRVKPAFATVKKLFGEIAEQHA